MKAADLLTATSNDKICLVVFVLVEIAKKSTAAKSAGWHVIHVVMIVVVVIYPVRR